MNIDRIIAEYLSAKETERLAANHAKELQALIFDAIGKAETLATDDYTVIVKSAVSVRLDTKALYNDFPDIKKEYGKETLSRSLVVAEKSALKTA